MSVNRIQAAIGIVSGIALLVIVLFPAWQEAAEKEVSYRKDLGHGLLWSPPKPVAVDCYFVGCVTAPASYFHVLLNRTLLLKQSLTLLWVTVAFIWIYRTRRSGETASLTVPATRLLTSFLLALLIPPGGDVPFGAGLVAIPHLLAPVGDFVLIPTIIVIVMFFGCVLIIFGLLSVAVRLVASRTYAVRQR